MAVEPTKPLYTGNIVLDDGTDLPALSGGTREDQQMQAANTQGVVAIQSVDQRVHIAVETTNALAEVMLANMGQMATATKRLTAGCDPNDQTDANTLHFAEQLQSTVADVYLRTLHGAHQKKVLLAGSDIRKAITPPPPPPQPPPVIVQHTGPELEPAPLFTTRQKYVIKERSRG